MLKRVLVCQIGEGFTAIHPILFRCRHRNDLVNGRKEHELEKV